MLISLNTWISTITWSIDVAKTVFIGQPYV